MVVMIQLLFCLAVVQGMLVMSRLLDGKYSKKTTYITDLCLCVIPFGPLLWRVGVLLGGGIAEIGCMSWDKYKSLR